jgi:hypothetical protein
MSSIDSISSAIYVPPSRSTQGVQSTQRGGGDSDGDGDGGQKVRKSGGGGHGHGQMQNVLMQALQSLGLSAPAGTSSTSSTTASSGTSQSSSSTDSDGDSDGSTSAVGNTKADMRSFMHALFQAVKGQSSSSSGTSASSAGTSGATDPKANFASGLSALISQVSSGQAPADLQSAFAQVVTDLQGAGGASTSGSGTGSGTGTTASPQVSLQALLSQMQQNLGYGATSSSSALGNIVSQHA